MIRLINITDVIGDAQCLPVAKHELLLDNAPELSAFPIEYECHYLDGVPDSVTPEPFDVAMICCIALSGNVDMEVNEATSIIKAIKDDAQVWEEKNWTNIFADDSFEESWLDEENDEEETK